MRKFREVSWTWQLDNKLRMYVAYDWVISAMIASILMLALWNYKQKRYFPRLYAGGF